jgi:hypothetical protein
VPAVVLIHEDPDGDTVGLRRVRLRDRLAGILRAHDLDRQLAEGVPPERSAALSLRARRLLRPSTAVMLSRGVQRVLHDIQTHEPGGGRMPVRRQAVRAVAGDLERLARRLVSPQPIGVAGLARVRLLLSDGSGPLFSSRAREDLSAAVARALAGLEAAGPS